MIIIIIIIIINNTTIFPLYVRDCVCDFISSINFFRVVCVFARRVVFVVEKP
jgi:hypothetical protein